MSEILEMFRCLFIYLLSILRVCDLQVVWNGKPRENSQALIPHVEDGTHGLNEGDVVGVEMVGSHGVVEGQVPRVVVQQHAQAAQMWGGLYGHLFAIVPCRPGVVAPRQHPGSRVLANPFMLGSRFVCNANSKPGTLRERKK